MRKLYYDPMSTVSRPIALFLAEHGLEVERVPVSLMDGEHQSDWYAAINPNRAVPALEEDGFVLTESATILRYLAGIADSPAYPADPRARARVDEALDWFNTGFYRDHGYGIVYPQVLPHYRIHETQRSALLGWHRARAELRLQVLNNHMIGDDGLWVAGEDYSIADMFGASLVTIGDLVDFDLTPWPNVCRWLTAVQARPAWRESNQAFAAWCAAMRTQPLAA
jgi:glutathione S-transferase